jgi:anti-sigma regulatory factor (Ser/Thr protein kinase)
VTIGRGDQDSPWLEPILEIRFSPVWEYIDSVREFCRSFCMKTFNDEATVERLCLAIQELTENAVKYGDPAATGGMKIEIQAKTSGMRLFQLVVSNPTTQQGHEALTAQLRTLYELPAEEAYMAAMQRSLAAAGHSGQLGLARIRFEAGLDLSADMKNGWVHVVASGRADR